MRKAGYELAFDARQFHVYEAEWTPDRVAFFVDNRLVKTVEQAPRYPMQLMLSIYDPSGGDGEAEHDPWLPIGSPHGSHFSVDDRRLRGPRAPRERLDDGGRAASLARRDGRRRDPPGCGGLHGRRIGPEHDLRVNQRK